MKKRRILLSSLLVLVFMFAIGVVGASAEDVTWNPNDKTDKATLSNGNLTVVLFSSSAGVRATEGKNIGKWYWEVKPTAGNCHFIGFGDSTAFDYYPGHNSNSWSYYYNGRTYHAGTIASYGASYNRGDVIGIALDMDAGTASFYKNGVSQNTAFTGLTGILFPMVGYGSTTGSSTMVANFGATPFDYPIPEGYQPYNGSQQTIQAPTNLTATPGDTQITLSWTAVDGATSYKVKRSETAGGPYETVADSVYEPTYVNTGLTNDTTYYYVVTAVTASGESGNSNEAYTTPQAGTTPPATGNGTLIVTVANNADREYNLTMAQIQEFIDWYNNRSTGGNVYVIEKTATSPYTRVKDYLIFDKIVAWQVKEY